MVEEVRVGERIVLIDEDARNTPVAQSSESLAPVSGKYLMGGARARVFSAG